MSAIYKRRRKKRAGGFSSGRLSAKRTTRRQPGALVFFLSVVILIETLLILFLLPQKFKKSDSAVQKTYSYVETQKVKKRTAAKTQPKKELRAAPVVTPKKENLKQPSAPAKGRIALVIDDWGYNKDNVDFLSKIKPPLTIAILPFRTYSRTVAEIAHRQNCEIIIHMPMEPQDKERVDLEPKTLMTYMRKETIADILDGAFKSIVYAKGLNNHMGSLATEDTSFMSHVFAYLKNKKGVYFLDSYVTADSVCREEAQAAGVPFARRTIFLDNKLDYSYIAGQVSALARKAAEDGFAIGIGHDRKLTLRVLDQKIPELEKEGYQFVFVSELAQ